MSLQIKNNAAAFNVFANYAENMSKMRTSLTRVSTGVKSVKDDAAGVGISERMRSQIRSSAMARQNVESGMAMLRTADGWMQKVNDMLARMHELAIEANGVTTSTDRENIATEFKQLQEEISRVTSHGTAAAKFNGLYLFRGGNGQAESTGDGINTGSITMQVGADYGQTLGLSLANLANTSTEVMGTVHAYTYDNDNTTLTGSTHTQVTWGSIINDTVMSVNSDKAIAKVQLAINFVADARATIGAQQSRIEQARGGLMSYEDNLRSAESKIRDVDMARESSELAKYQVLGQVSTAMLAQANQMPAAAAQLLGG